MSKNDMYSRPGPKSLSEKVGEETRMFKFMLTESQYEFISEQDLSAAAYLRYLIEFARMMNGYPNTFLPSEIFDMTLGELRDALTDNKVDPSIWFRAFYRRRNKG